MLDHINDIWNNCLNWLGDLTNEAIGHGFIALGTHIEEVAGIIIMIGVLLWICKYTKVFRYGCISYAVGLLVELIGSVMIK